MKKETIWNKKYCDWTLKDGLKLSLVAGSIYGGILILIANLEKWKESLRN